MKSCPLLIGCLVVLGLTTGITGCASYLDRSYCSPRGDSINGLSVFIQTLRDAGHKVEVSRFLNKSLAYRHAGLILFHDKPGPIDPDDLQKIIKVISDSPVGLVLLVARNGDLNETYFSALVEKQKNDPEGQKDALDYLKNARINREGQGESEFSLQEGKFFGLKKAAVPNPVKETDIPDEYRTITVVDPEGRLADTTRAVRARWPALRGLIIPPEAETLWATGADPLLAEYEMAGTRILVLAGAVPLLNAGLVDEGNRALCSALLSELEYLPSLGVVTSTTWVERNPEEEALMLRLLRIQPLPWIFGHVAVAILLFCWWRFPILGRPREGMETETRRFGRHVDALGQLLRSARGAAFARDRFREWNRPGKQDISQGEE